MTEQLDQIFVNLLHWVVGFFPAGLQAIVSMLISITAIIQVFPIIFALTTVIERKGLGRIQNRYGPNRVGLPFTNLTLFGFGQFIADGLKTLFKEDVVPRVADRVVHYLAPLVLVVPIVLLYAVIPFGRNMYLTDMDAGLLFFFAVGAATELSVFMAGWSSRNKYSLLGAMRAVAQMISYEVPLILSAVTVVMITGTLSLVKIVAAQGSYVGILPHWFVFTPWGFAGFVLFVIAATAESNRTPFDLPEGESEIIAGYYIEYSGFKFANFFLGEYLGLFAISSVAITLFLGGWHAPLPILEVVPSWAWYFIKLGAFIAFFIWVRGTLPRLRQDQLMNFAWKFMLPMSLVNILAAGIWHFMPAGPTRWLVDGVIVFGAYLWLGAGFAGAYKPAQRVYRFAD
jgi:NADH-quinone oxidoreductase subunit H